MILRVAFLALVALAALATPAAAYPQFQLASDATCSGCHISPAGGGLLNENGHQVAESMAQFGADATFFYGKVPTPSWLTLGGDLRTAYGFMATPEKVLVAFPMQAEFHLAAKFGPVSVHGSGGYRSPRDETGEKSTTLAFSREHFLMWKQKPDENEGMFVRAGRFMPVFGLRLAEHPIYTRRFGGTQLYSETYGLSAAYVHPKFEAHVSGFIEDPLVEPVEHDDGGAAYGETRITETSSVGAGFMYSRTDDDAWYRYQLTGKQYIAGPKLLLQAEVQLANQIIDRTTTNPDGGAPLQIIGYLMGSMMLGDFVMVDLGLGHFDSNIRIKDLDRNAVDLNVHYFVLSHFELVLNARYEMIAFGNGGPSGGYALIQFHYRL